MIAVVREWYRGRSKREQRMLLGMVAIAVPVLLWALMIRPLDNAQDQALQEHLEAVDRHGRVLALAEAVESEPSRPRIAGDVDLQLVVTEAATLSGITLTDVAPSSSDSVSVTASSARAPAAAEWLRQLEVRGLVIEELLMTPAAEGGASVSARFARR